MTDDSPNMPARKPVRSNVAVVAVVTLAMAVGVFIIITTDKTGQTDNHTPGDSKTTGMPKADAAMKNWELAATWPVAIKGLSAVAVDPAGRVYVAGGRDWAILDSGQTVSAGSAEAPVHGLAAGSNGTWYIALADRIIEMQDGQLSRVVASLGDKARIKGISLRGDGERLFVADGGNCWVWIIGCQDGGIDGYIGRDDLTGKAQYRVERLSCFDVAATPDRLLVTDPAAHAIDSWDLSRPEMPLSLRWQKGSDDGIAGFFGCCNPAHIAAMPDGRIVTSDKGSDGPRLRVFDAQGNLLSVIAEAEDLPSGEKLVDIATDSRGYVYAADGAAGCIRVYRQKGSLIARENG